MQRKFWAEIKRTYPNEWVALADIEGDIEHSYGEIAGTLLVHHPNEQEFTRQLKQLINPAQIIDIRYTGDLLPDNPVGPILWQFSPTTS